MKEKVILHCDCNSFYASVESALHPEYKNVPMAVCGSESDRHGIVLAKNELAKKYGIQTAETVFSAKKKCPSLVIVPPHHDLYLEYSRKVNDIYQRYTDMVEPFGIDESWLDVTASQKLFGSGIEIAEAIRAEVKEKIGITVSIGVSFNKVFAKLGSDYKKPDAITVIDKENFKNIVFPLPASDLLYVGRKTAEALHSMGVKTIGELAATSREMLKMKFGKMGEMLYSYANGLDDTPVLKEHEDAKSVSNGFTFRHDLVSHEESRVGIDYLSFDIGRRLRRNGQVCSTVSLTIKDEYLCSIQRQRSLAKPTDISREIADAAYSILLDEWSEARPIRMLTVSVSSLTKKELVTEQLSFFESPEEPHRDKLEKRELAIDKIRQKFGSESIISGAIIDSDIGIYTKQSENEKNENKI